MRAVRIVDLHHAASVKHVVDIEVSLYAQPLAQPHELGEAYVESPDPMIVEAPRRD